MTTMTTLTREPEAGGDQVSPDLAVLTHTDFAPHRNEVFKVHQGPLSVATQLVSVAPWGGPQASGRQAFTLTFRGPDAPVLPQQIHVVEHPVLGRMEIFLVPVGPDGAGMQYEAVFS